MGLSTKAIAICAGKKASHYYQNNERSGKLLPIKLD